MTWFSYHDCHGGGYLKSDYSEVIVEASTREHADDVFEARMDCAPYQESCECCGPDFYIREFESLNEALEYRTSIESAPKYLVIDSEGKESVVQ